MSIYEEKIWQPLIDALKVEDKKEFDNRFVEIFNKYNDVIKNCIMYRYSCSEETAEDCIGEANLMLLLNIQHNNYLKFESEKALFNFLYTIALRKAIELISRAPKIVTSEDADKIPYTPKYFNLPSGNVFKDLYDGRNDIDAFLKDEVESVKLLELRFIKNYSYEKIRTLAEYSNYTKESLRQKVSRGLRKYKEFIKE